ncbi:MAG TPA: tRNA dihydrouridine synthase DusB [Bacteroidales bacterium]|nr:tRNA dihydrouridine synthase DusB [Bacteroidales bacterium]HOR81315.1 tRNA dihydrouridine synthase DusB [Bacteroidales bacterium]HPJ90793.1 tRNA dihydrouridine synthase DusB [Bacteroidales bacterium]
MNNLDNIFSGGTKLLLAPMDDITDFSFRTICKELGAEITISEFVASDALIRNIEKTKRKMFFLPDERPFGIQLFGNNKETMREAAIIIETYQPDFIDINWGCPAKRVAGKGSGSGMLKNIPLLLEITEDIVKSVKLPVTVKTRLGYDDNSKCIVELSEKLQDVGVQAITIHGRTKTQMFKGEADWSLIGAVKANHRITIPIIGNGDIVSAEQALAMKEKHRINGIMIGRAAMGNPWIFKQCRALLDNDTISYEPTISERIEVCKKHFLLSVEYKGEYTGVLEMRKHYKGYFKGINDFKTYRIKLLSLINVKDIVELFDEINYKFSL